MKANTEHEQDHADLCKFHGQFLVCDIAWREGTHNNPGGLRIDYTRQVVTAAGQTLKKGEVITIDGSTGQVMKGRVPTIQPEL
ncbi:MAG: hypothetical protein ACK6DM_15740, partial [Alphaproteobacteria bacterium]